MKCLFDGDSKKIIDSFMKEYESEMKDVKKEIEETDKKLHDDVKKAGVKIDDEKLDKNGLVVAGVIDDEKNKDKSGKELTKEVDAKIKQSEEAKELIKQAKESEKKLDQIKVDPKIEKMSDEELAKAVEEADKKEKSGNKDEGKNANSIVKEIDEKLTAKLGKDYKQSLLTGIYSKEELSKNAKKNKLGKVDFSSIKSDKVVGIRIDFFGDEAADVVNEVVDDKAGFVVRKVDSSEKDEGVKKVYDTFSKVLKDAVGDDAEGDVVAFLKHWQGKNDDGNFDSLFVFVGLKVSKTNESMNESGSFKKNIVSSMKDLVGTKMSADEYVEKISKMSMKTADDVKIATAMLVKNGMEENDAIDVMTRATEKLDIPDLNTSLEDNDIETYALNPSFADDLIDDATSDAASGAVEKAVEKAGSVSNAGSIAKDLAGSSKLNGISVPDKFQAQAYILSKQFDTPKEAAKHMKNWLEDQPEYSKLPSASQKQMTGYFAKAVSNPDKLLNGIDSDTKKALASQVQSGFEGDIDDFTKDNGINIDSAKTAAKEVGTVMKGQAADTAASGIEKGASDNFGKVKNGFAAFSDGTTRPSFNYQSMSGKISDLEEIFKDGEVSPEELEKFQKMGDRLTQYIVWAEENKDSTDVDIQNRIALIKRMQSKYDMMTLDHGDELNNAGAFDSPRIIDDSDGIPKDQAKNVSKAAAVAENDEDAQKASGGWKKALGLDKAFTALGIARLAAKSTGIVLNHGKAVIDMAGAQAMKYKEDKNIIADFRITLTNGEGSKSKFEDTKFAVRFDVNDCKWHATCLDDRKMKFPEEKLIKVALESEEGKKFKKYCLNRWKAIFVPEDERKAIIPFILKNAEKLGMGNGKLPKEFITNIKKMSEKFDKIEAALK